MTWSSALFTDYWVPPMYPEDELIDMIRKRFADTSARVGIGDASVRVGIGDDAAVIDLSSGFSTLVCSDLLAENTHFRRETHPPDSVGFKAVAVNVSDIGAMGGIPDFCLLSVALPRDLERSWIDAFLDGVAAACREFEISLVGGDSSAADRVFVDVSVIGQVRRGSAVLRSGARSGNNVYITGSLGGSAMGLELLEEGRRDHPAVRRSLYPEPRHRIGSRVADRATAMIDISDGLSADLTHILEASSVSARITSESIPLHPGADVSRALHSGEEYELIVTAEDLPREIDGVSITCIGQIVPSGEKPQILLIEGLREQVLDPKGWKHF